MGSPSIRMGNSAAPGQTSVAQALGLVVGTAVTLAAAAVVFLYLADEEPFFAAHLPDVLIFYFLAPLAVAQASMICVFVLRGGGHVRQKGLWLFLAALNILAALVLGLCVLGYSYDLISLP